MTDAVQVTTIHNSPKRVVVHCTNVSDGTGESAIKKLDKSTYTGPDGTAVGRFSIQEVRCNIQTTNGGYVKLDYDHTTDDEICVLSGTDYIDFRPYGGMVDPDTTGGTGDVVVTTGSFAAGDTYDLTIHALKKD